MSQLEIEISENNKRKMVNLRSLLINVANPHMRERIQYKIEVLETLT